MFLYLRYNNETIIFLPLNINTMKTNNFNAINYNSFDLQNIERTCKIFTDLRNEQTNTRTTIYEVEKFKKYVCIIKQGGEYKRYLIAQNTLAILLNL